MEKREKPRSGLGSGASGVGDVHFCLNKALPNPWQVKPGGVYVARVATPAHGVVKLQLMLQRGGFPRPVAVFRRSSGIVTAKVKILTRRPSGRWQRKAEMRAFRTACDALEWSVDMLKLSDRLERALIQRGLDGLRAVDGGAPD